MNSAHLSAEKSLFVSRRMAQHIEINSEGNSAKLRKSKA
jgi:hypothetical protein